VPQPDACPDDRRVAADATADDDLAAVTLLGPSDAFDTLAWAAATGLRPRCVMLDPWYNKGFGGVVDPAEYDAFLVRLLSSAAATGADHVYLWGFPEIVARIVTAIPPPLELVAWLTWYYKNNPSVIRGWRSAQMTCLHLGRPGARLFPEHFFNEAQKAKQAAGKLRYTPGPPSVIEAALLVGFVGRAEQTGHPSQKPVAVFEPLLDMVMEPGDVVLDPMCGSGTTGAAAVRLGLRAVLADASDEYLALCEERLGVTREPVPPPDRPQRDRPPIGRPPGRHRPA
jgi:site-specific DNA-methyltransferase (adenine-specific)